MNPRDTARDPHRGVPPGRAASEAEGDEPLIAAIAAGDRAAFRSLYVVYHRRLGRFLQRFLRSHELIEEVINDTLYAVWCQARDFRGESQVSTWIFGIAYRKALKAVRKDRRGDEVEPLPIGEALTSVDPAQRRDELRQCIDRALASLPTAQRLVVELAYFVGHSCEEIAAITDSPVATVKTRLYYARERLRTLLPELRTGRSDDDR